MDPISPDLFPGKYLNVCNNILSIFIPELFIIYTLFLALLVFAVGIKPIQF